MREEGLNGFQTWQRATAPRGGPQSVDRAQRSIGHFATKGGADELIAAIPRLHVQGSIDTGSGSPPTRSIS